MCQPFIKFRKPPQLRGQWTPMTTKYQWATPPCAIKSAQPARHMCGCPLSFWTSLAWIEWKLVIKNASHFISLKNQLDWFFPTDLFTDFHTSGEKGVYVLKKLGFMESVFCSADYKKQRIKLTGNFYSTRPMNQKIGLEGQIKISSLHQLEGSWSGSEVYMLCRKCSGCLSRDRNDLWQYPTSVVLLMSPAVLNGWWLWKNPRNRNVGLYSPYLASTSTIIYSIIDRHRQQHRRWHHPQDHQLLRKHFKPQ